MKKIILTVGALALLLSGCVHLESGYSKQTYKTGGGQTFESTDNDGMVGISIREKPDRLSQRMRAEGDLELKKGQAEMLRNISTRQQQVVPAQEESEKKKQTKSKSSANDGNIKVIGFVNNDPSKSCYFFHPQVPKLKIALESGGGFGLVEVTQLPSEVVLYDLYDDKLLKKVAIKNKPGQTYEYAGVKFDSFTYINEIY